MSYAPQRTSYDADDNRCFPNLEKISTDGINLDGSAFPDVTFPGGLVKVGTLLGQNTTTKLWGPYDDTATDGRETARRLLRNTTVVKAGVKHHVAAVHAGTVDRRHLPANSGFDAAAKADMPAVVFLNA